MNRYDQFEEVQKAWTAPRELMRSAPRTVGLSSKGILLGTVSLILFLGAIAAGALMSAASLRQTRNDTRLNQEGRETDARIARLWRSAEKNRTAHVEYWFDFEGRKYRNDSRVPLSIWKTLKKGGSLRVRFLPSNAGVSHPSDWANRPLPIWLALLVSAVLAGVAAGIAALLRRQINLLAEGRPAAGVITRVRHVRHSHGGDSTIVYYQFRVLSGGIEKGRSHAAGRSPKTGDPVSVVYDPNDPGRSAVYPLPLVRVT